MVLCEPTYDVIVYSGLYMIFCLFVFCRISDRTFDHLRIAVILLCCVVRFVFTKIHLQVFLDVAKRKVVRMKKEAGRISNVTLQKKASKLILDTYINFKLFISVLL